MSIIERAAGRLNKNKEQEQDQVDPAKAVEAGAVAPEQQSGDRIVAAMERSRAHAHEAAQEAAAPIPAANPLMDVPAPSTPAASTPAASTLAASPAPTTPFGVPAAPLTSTFTPPAAAPAPFTAVRNYAPRKIEIDLTKLSELGFITAGGGRSLIAEQFRMIKRPLIKMAFEEDNGTPNPGNLIMVTSALPGEGKTYCSINLAMSIAMELDHTVLLVDIDVARPSVLRTLSVEPKPGLMDVLLDNDKDMADVMLRTNVDTLSILPSGRSSANAAEILASQAMQTMLEEIASRYPDRIVIFDSPPLLMTSEAQVLASKMGQIVLVVEAESTTQQAVKSSLEQLQGCANVSLIYNKSNAKSYGYGYGNYY
jgi:protein-tyrosine kinase